MKYDNSFANTIKFDLRASVMVFFVALPLCLGVALASDAPAFSGIIAGIIGGIVVGFFSNSQIGVSGPAAGLTTIVAAALIELGSFDIFLTTVVLAGIIQIALGLVKSGGIAKYIPSSVIKGMLAAIGIIIILKQIPHAVGYSEVVQHFNFEQKDGNNTFNTLIVMLDHMDIGAIIIALVSFAILLVWDKPAIKKLPVLSEVPGSVVVVAVGILLYNLFAAIGPASGIPGLALTRDLLVNIPTADTTLDFIKLNFELPNLSMEVFSNMHIWTIAFTIAAVASIETLLSLEASDKIDPQKRIADPNTELKAQGIGNMISGLIGGLPITQVVVRSSANVQAGGKTKKATMLHGALLLISVLFIPDLLNMIPFASLAAILILVGYKLASPAVIKAVYGRGKSEFIPYIATLVSIVLTDILIGVIIGLALAIIQIIYKTYLKGFLDKEYTKEGDVVVIKLGDHISFIHKAKIAQELNDIENDSRVVIDTSDATTVDYDIIDLLADFKGTTAERNISLEIRDTVKESPLNKELTVS